MNWLRPWIKTGLFSEKQGMYYKQLQKANCSPFISVGLKPCNLYALFCLYSQTSQSSLSFHPQAYNWGRLQSASLFIWESWVAVVGSETLTAVHSIYWPSTSRRTSWVSYLLLFLTVEQFSTALDPKTICSLKIGKLAFKYCALHERSNLQKLVKANKVIPFYQFKSFLMNIELCECEDLSCTDVVPYAVRSLTFLLYDLLLYTFVCCYCSVTRE